MAVYVAHDDVMGFANLPKFSVRNGPAGTASSLLVRPTIPTGYRWVEIEGMPANRATEFVDVFILEHMVHLTNHRPDDVPEPKIRTAAIALGTSRAVATQYYELTATDLMRGEVVPSVSRYVAPTAAIAAAEGVAAAAAVPEGFSLKDAAATPAATRTMMTTPLALTEDEQAIVSTLLLATLGTIPVQGFSLINTSHHYLSDNKGPSRKAFMAIEKQFFRAPPMATWFSENEVLLTDLLWHKACHPVSLTIKERAACSEAVKDQLIEAGAGSAATRLPAVETAVRAGKAYKALFDTLRPFFTMFEGSLDSSLLDLAITTAESIVPGTVRVPAAQGAASRVPAEVITRKDAVRWVSQIVEGCTSTAAFCYGFYVGMVERDATFSANPDNDSLRSAFSLKKLPGLAPASFMAGKSDYGDYYAAKMKWRKNATYAGPKFTI